MRSPIVEIKLWKRQNLSLSSVIGWMDRFSSHSLRKVLKRPSSITRFFMRSITSASIITNDLSSSLLFSSEPSLLEKGNRRSAIVDCFVTDDSEIEILFIGDVTSRELETVSPYTLSS